MENGKLKILTLISALVMSVNFAYADSYIMVAPANITKVDCANNKVLNFHVLSTLMNEKKSVIVNSLSDGQTSFSLYMKNKKCDYKATVQNGKLTIKGDNAIKVLPVDLPPELEGTEGCE